FGQTRSFTFTVRVDRNLTAVTVISNVAQVTVPGEPTVLSYPPVDNTVPTEPDETAPPGTNIDVDALRTATFTKVGRNQDNLRKAEDGDLVTYTFTVVNTGNKDLKNLVITDPLASENVTFQSSGINGGMTGSTWQYEVGYLAVGVTKTAASKANISI